MLKTVVVEGWSAAIDEFKGTILIGESTKGQLREALLGIATGQEEDRKVRSAASYVVSKIASSDFPDQWPTLLPTLLHIIPTGTQSQVHGALKVLGDLVEEGLNDDQFFGVARDLVKVIYDTAIDDSKKLTLRALGMSRIHGGRVDVAVSLLIISGFYIQSLLRYPGDDQRESSWSRKTIRRRGPECLATILYWCFEEAVTVSAS